MKFAIIADIHANLEALQVVLEDTKAQKCTHYACLGDVVGYNANPKECLDIVRSMGMPCVKGNHDEYCSAEVGLEGFNPAAAEAVEWTRQQLDETDRAWLRDLKYMRMVTSFSIVHATLDVPQRWGYVFDKLAAAASFTYQNTAVCFFGHTHVPVAFVRDAEGDMGMAEKADGGVLAIPMSPSLSSAMPARSKAAPIPNSKSNRAKNISSTSAASAKARGTWV